MMLRIALIIVLLGLTGCTTLRPVESPHQSQSRKALLALGEWEFSGRIAVRSHAGQGDGQATLRWSQSGDNTRLRISGPFGAQASELVWTPGRVSVTTADGEQALEYRGPRAAEAFLQDQLGWSFPAGSARYWVMGLADPSGPAEEQFDAAGGLTGLRQYDWQLDFERFTTVNEIVLPTRINMTSSNASLRIAIGKWKLTPEAD